MEANYTITEDDYVRATKLFTRLTPKSMAVFGLVVAVLVVLMLFGSPVVRGAAMGGLIGGGVMFLLGRFVINPLLCRRHYRSYKAIQEPTTMTLMDDGIRFEAESGTAMVSWDKILKWRHNDRYILIYPMPRLYYIVPKAAGPGFDPALLIKALSARVGSAR
ncbi:hypothetical protein B5T_00506 [Alloalcanivorax dieselolei B5]|uniref:YcxB-like C-terminal domain-containing protein n=1 Tax=Alcanivorax dieselolei (strain DSM 16502 / CGMCC 1.3690 / MCCC 1A00001 / B-5) TaxID=930169 RepID=K0CBE9_ALCDB|nr:YcxB family protein [Alloalcanivorax dieselolei]AFT68791.1 hypothetical protein B5T_00506 [Alloalcanivorax dieselolei B5]GGK06764.1 hypothetical protein GCM10007426_39210 [Alloalcanivorax dieselolei]